MTVKPTNLMPVGAYSAQTDAPAAGSGATFATDGSVSVATDRPDGRLVDDGAPPGCDEGSDEEIDPGGDC